MGQGEYPMGAHVSSSYLVGVKDRRGDREEKVTEIPLSFCLGDQQNCAMLMQVFLVDQ